MNTIEKNHNDYRLLVIDDEIEVTKSIVRQFRKKYDVFSANSGEEALDIMEKNDIQVIISDQRMPGMTGVDFFARIKEKYPESLKLILTGYSDIEAVVGAINDGQVFRYITKPWIPEELNGIIAEAFQKYELITKNKKLMRSLELANTNLEEKVRDRTKQLEELNILKNRYIGIVAHDLRNPIGVAESFSDLLIEEYDDFSKEEQLHFINIIHERCGYSLALVNEFLDISKIESGTLNLELVNQDYISFAKRIISNNKLFAKKKSQEILLESELNEIYANFDKNKLEQVFNNLISNAIKFSSDHTVITIKISLKDNHIISRIVDQGQGIPASEIENIFIPYKTTSVKATKNEKSTGLGLAIAKKIIEAHNGAITVESVVDKGSVFAFSIDYNLS